MSGKQIPEAERQAAADRIINKQSSPAKEATKYGVSPRAVRNWVTARRGGAAAPPAKDPEPRIADAPTHTETQSNPGGHRAALEAIGEDPGPETDDAIDAADRDRIVVDAERMSDEDRDEAEAEFDREAAEQEALDTLADLKAEIVEFAVDVKFSPHLDANDPRVERAKKPGPFLRRCVRKNVETIGPMMDGVAASPWALLGALFIDGLLTVRRVKKAAAANGWKQPGETEEPGEPVKTRDAAPMPKAPPPPPAPAEPAPGRGRILDAPALPFTPEE